MAMRLLFVSVVLALAGCRSKDVVARVGSTDVHKGDVEAYAKTQSPAPLKTSLDAVVAREVLAEGARRRGLDERPEVAARLAAAHREILAQAIVDEVTGKIDEAQVAELYKTSKDRLAVRQLQLAHIFFVFTPGTSKDAVTSRATATWARLIGGDDFATVAAEVSDDAATKGRGGDLGLVREGQVSAIVFEPATKLEAGAFSKPIATDYGLHIIKAVTKVETILPSYDEVKGTLLAQLRRQAEAQLGEQLGGEVSVKRFPESLEAGAK